MTLTITHYHDEESGIDLSSSSSSQVSQVSSSLPSPNQSWSHSTCSISKLSRALNDPSITAIETDILMGWHIPSATTTEEEEDIDVSVSVTTVENAMNAPKRKDIHSRELNEWKQQQVPQQNQQQDQVIMAHPPYNSSDLTFFNFQQMNMKGGSLSKHLKLDFKDYESVPLVLNQLLNGDNDGDNDDNESSDNDNNHDNGKDSTTTNASDLNRLNPGGRYTIYLNADVLPGPGFRPGRDVLNISADRFLSTCLKFIEEDYCHHVSTAPVVALYTTG
jgi:hypothetical protein